MNSPTPICIRRVLDRPTPPKAFTLLELLGVVTIALVLIGLLFPLVGEMRTSAQKADTISKLRQLHLAFVNYAADREGRIPPSYSSEKDEAGKTYGSWNHYLNTYGYIQPPSENEKLDKRFSCKRQLAQFTPTDGDLRTIAMNDRIGDHPTYHPHGARRMTQVANPTATALLMNGPWDGTHFDIVTKENYVDLMRSCTPFKDATAVLFVDGHVELRSLESIPRQISETAEKDGFNFWRGGIRTP